MSAGNLQLSEGDFPYGAPPSGSVEGLLDHLLVFLKCKNDYALSVELGVSHALISRLRHGNGKIGAAFILKAHDRTGLSVSTVRELAGLPLVRVK